MLYRLRREPLHFAARINRIVDGRDSAARNAAQCGKVVANAIRYRDYAVGHWIERRDKRGNITPSPGMAALASLQLHGEGIPFADDDSGLDARYMACPDGHQVAI